jgi:hypothetical protein
LIEQFIINHFGDIVLCFVVAYCMYRAHKQEQDLIATIKKDNAEFRAEREAYWKKRDKISAENHRKIKELTEKFQAKHGSSIKEPPAC